MGNFVCNESLLLLAWTSLLTFLFQLVEYLLIWISISMHMNHFYFSLSLHLQQSDHNAILIDLTISIIMVFWTFFIILVFFEIGELVSKQFDMFNAELCQCNWYLYPIEMQKMLIIFMSNAQQLTFIRGLGNILCTRSKVKEVRKSSKWWVVTDEVNACQIINFYFYAHIFCVRIKVLYSRRK